MCHCDLCDIDFGSSLKCYMSHISKHRNVHNYMFKCGACSCVYKKYASLSSHYYRKHCCAPYGMVVSKCDSNAQHQTVKCTLNACSKEFQSMPQLVKHMKTHLNEGLTIICPYLNCDSKYDHASSLTSHIARKHSRQHYQEASNKESTIIFCELENNDNLENSFFSSVEEGESAVQHELVTNSGALEEAFSLFLLKLESKLIVPQSTIQAIVDEIAIMSELSNQVILSKLMEALPPGDAFKLDVPGMLKTSTLTSLCEKKNGKFCSAYLRHQYYKKNFKYVGPARHFLGENDHGNACYVQYVPIRDSLKNLLDDCSVQQKLQYSKNQTLNVLTDYTDGSLFSSNEDIDLFLFQDAFEIVNPLGSSRKKHKLLAVYGVLGNLPPQHRYSLDNIFLVMLFKEQMLKAFGHNIDFSSLIQELAEIEKNGISLSYPKVRLCAIIGDNLGSHSIGGFVENFRGKYFCRFCLLQRQQFQSNPCSLGVDRDITSYEEALCVLEHNEDVSSHQGIKHRSVFNQLNGFHVCSPGLPPCLAHDIFEGVLAYDFALIIRHFVQVKWFSYTELNKNIMQFCYSGYDALSKPPVVPYKAKKLNGQAMENWCFLRLFPIIMFDGLIGKDDEVLSLLLTLREIVELVCAPFLEVAQISYMQILIEEYLALRTALFPHKTLKPKHHFLLHYPSLTLKFGPLIRMWTMRFESKHSYFKRCARNFSNFRNPASTLAVCHQLYQCYVHAGRVINDELMCTGTEPLIKTLYSSTLQELFTCFGLNERNSVIVASAIVHGTLYKAGLILIVKRTSVLNMIFSKIVLVLCKDNREVHFVMQDYSAKLVPNLGIYKLGLPVGSVYCVKIHKIADYMPLLVYNVSGCSLVALKHAVC